MENRTYFELHILPLVRELDRRHMLIQRPNPPLDLWDPAVVAEKASLILSMVGASEPGTVMPPKAYGGPWPAEWIALFKRWVSEGCARLDLGGATAYEAVRYPNFVAVTATLAKPGPNFAVWPDRYFGPPKGGVLPDLVLYQKPLDSPPPLFGAEEGVGVFTFPEGLTSLRLLDRAGIQTLPITAGSQRQLHEFQQRFLRRGRSG